MARESYNISKTSFLKFEQCKKSFYLYRNFPQLRDKLSTDKQLTFKRGHEVGDLAQQLFPGGTDVSKITKSVLAAAEETQQLLSAGTNVIYEATFIYQMTVVMVDILVKEADLYTAYEVKSSLKVSEHYIRDACLQYYVLKHSLPAFDDIYLVTLNPDYVLEDNLDVKKLFRKRSMKERAEANMAYFETQIAAANQLISEDRLPEQEIGRHCFRPYQCDFFGHCWKNQSGEKSIFNLPLISRERLFELFSEGIKTTTQLESKHLLKEQHQLVLEAFETGHRIVDVQAVKNFTSKIRQPFAAFDMEVWSPAVPAIKGTSSFAQLPFLVCFYDGNKHKHFISDYEKDDRRLFAEALIKETANYETLLVYDKNLETGVISALQSRFPDLGTDLEKIKSRMLDVFEIFLNLSYYDPRFRNNFSLKTVSSFLLPDLRYNGITSGMEAMAVFEKMRQPGDLFTKQILIDELVEYCNTDCEATFKLVEFLQNLDLKN